MDADNFDSGGGSAIDHGFQMVDVAVNIAVRKESDKVQSTIVVNGIGDQFFPGFALKKFAAGDRLIDELCALRKNSAATDGVVSDLTVAHIGIGGHTDSGSVSLETG